MRGWWSMRGRGIDGADSIQAKGAAIACAVSWNGFSARASLSFQHLRWDLHLRKTKCIKWASRIRLCGRISLLGVMIHRLLHSLPFRDHSPHFPTVGSSQQLLEILNTSLIAGKFLAWLTTA
jgi:hypothetical protein